MSYFTIPVLLTCLWRYEYHDNQTDATYYVTKSKSKCPFKPEKEGTKNVIRQNNFINSSWNNMHVWSVLLFVNKAMEYLYFQIMLWVKNSKTQMYWIRENVIVIPTAKNCICPFELKTYMYLKVLK